MTAGSGRTGRRLTAGIVACAALGLAPVATVGAPAQAADGCSALPPLTACPDTQITDHPADPTTLTTATFAFTWSESGAAVPETSGVTFQCRLTTPTDPGTFADCATQPAAGSTTGGQSYAGLAAGDYTFTVHATGASGTGPDATYAWTVDPAAPPPTDDGTDPQTTITRKPGVFLRDDFTELRFSSDHPVDHYTCTLNGRDKGCTSSSSKLLRSIARGTYVFTVRATDTFGHVDPTPARAVFTRPIDSLEIARYSSGWTKRSDQGAFLDTSSLTRRKGAWAQQGTSAALRVALLVTKAPGYGAVKVYLGNTLLKKVSLAAPAKHKRQLVDVVRWSSPHKGTIRIVTTSAKPVVLEGLGIATTPKS